MIFILDGPDGSGKSRLAERLHQLTGYKVVHMTQPSEEDTTPMEDMYMQLLNANKNLILDRAWYSEMVYGPIMRGSSEISFMQMYELERAAKRNGALIIHCTGLITDLWKRCVACGESYVTDAGQYRDIWAYYARLMEDVPHVLPVLKYVYNQELS